MQSSTLLTELFDLLEGATVTRVEKPWGGEVIVDTGVFLLKLITVDAGSRTSLQLHERKEEVIVVAEGDGGVMTASGDDTIDIGVGSVTRIKPGTVHRTVGPVRLIELTSMDNEDVVRLADDYGR